MERIVGACSDAFARPGAPSPPAVTHVVVAGAADGRVESLAELPAALGLAAGIGWTLASARGGAAGLAGLRIADACCRGPQPATVLVACVGIAADGRHESAAALVASRALPASRDTLHLVRIATWTHRAGLGEMTLSQGESGFDLEGSAYLEALGTLDLPALFRDCVGLEAEHAGRIAWAVHADGGILDALEQSFGLDPRALGPSRRALRRHGEASAPAALFLLRGQLDRAGRSPIVAAGLGPGPTLEILRLASELRADAAADDLA